MKQKVFIILGLAVLIVALIGLNAVSYTQKDKQLDSEYSPNRSTFNLGSTGSRALFDLLSETGRKPVRWQETTAELLTNGKNKPSTFVIIGTTRQPISDDEAKEILKWVSEGGKLVVIDREPPANLVKTTANWNVSVNKDYAPDFTTDASDQTQMTAGIKAAKPIQPTVYTKGVNAVQNSRYAASIYFSRRSDSEAETDSNQKSSAPTPFPTFSKATPKYAPPPEAFPTANSNTNSNGAGYGRGNDSGDEEPVVIRKMPTPAPKPILKAAPVAHLSAENRTILADAPYGSGRIVFLGDPYIVANGGINLVDNAQLAINVLASGGGIIAFDEYHQGYGTNTNQFFQFFAGTPVIPIFFQFALIVAFVFFSQSRRFARAVPEPEPDRLSKLEYVSAMAELQQRTKGYDLAIENIYTDFRRRVSRLVGVDALKTRKQDLAQMIVERLPDEKTDELEDIMQKCEDIMHGEASNKKEVLRLTTRLRELEAKLGLQRRKRQRTTV